MSKKINKGFYKNNLNSEEENSLFEIEYNIILRTVESVNNLNLLYRKGRKGSKGGPSTHEQQDLYRAMLVFACAGLDVLLKQLVKTKLPDLISADKNAQEKFKEHVKRGINTKEPNKILNTVALALVDQNPKEIFLKEYIDDLTRDSLQAKEKIITIIAASGFNEKFLTTEKRNALKDAFEVRNQIIHEMDINTLDNLSKTRGYRTRRQRSAPRIEKHTKTILDLAKDIFVAYKNKFKEFKIETKKSSTSSKKT